MTIRLRLMLSIFAMLTVIVVVAGTGYLSAQRMQASMASVYADRVVPLSDLKDIADAYAVQIVDTSHKVRAGTMQPQAGLAEIAKARTTISEKWKAYTATKLTPEEAKLVEKARTLFVPADRAVEKLNTLLGASDKTALAAFVEQEMYPIIDAVSDAISQLISLQLVIAKEEYTASERAYDRFMIIMEVLLAVAALIVGGSVWVILRKVSVPLGRITGSMTQLAGGDLQADIPAATGRDEIAAMTRALLVFKDSMVAREKAEADISRQRAESEQRRAEREAREQAAGEEIAALVNKVGQGDLSTRISEAGKDGFFLSTSQELNRLAATLQTPHRDRADGVAVVRLFEGHEAPLLGAARELPVLVRHLHGDLDRGAPRV